MRINPNSLFHWALIKYNAEELSILLSTKEGRQALIDYANAPIGSKEFELAVWYLVDFGNRIDYMASRDRGESGAPVRDVE